MATITIPEETFQRLSRRAAALGTTVEAVAVPALEQVGEEPTSNEPEMAKTPSAPNDDWKTRFAEFLERARSRADRYPPGFEADVSRESIYEGCGE
jgi:hypothetical protein